MSGESAPDPARCQREGRGYRVPVRTLWAAAELLETGRGQSRAALPVVSRGTQAPAQGAGLYLFVRMCGAAAAGEGQVAGAKADKLQRAETVWRRRASGSCGAKRCSPPECFPPGNFEQHEIAGDPDFRESSAAELLHLQKGLFDHPPFLRPALSVRARN